jgi:hypothetical protein
MLHTLIDTFKEGEYTQNILAKMIYIQYVATTTYDTVDFDDPISTMFYFKKLFKPLTGITKSEEPQIDEMFTQMMWVWKGRVEKGSKKPIKIKGVHIMKSAAEKIHCAFRDIKPGSSTIQIDFALEVIIEAMNDLSRLLDESVIEDNFQSNHEIEAFE